MGTIQSSINAGLGTAAGALAAGKHLKQQQLNIDAANAADEQTVKTTKQAIRNDTIEAAAAIQAHEGNEEAFKKVFEGIDFNKLGELDDTGIEDLAKRVATYRTGKMTTDRIADIQESGERFQKYHDNKIDRIYKTGDNLKRAYNRFRELNQRIDASEQLKFDLESAEARLKARGVK